MATFTISDWKAAFKTQLEARGALSGVTVYDAEQSLPDTDREAIVLGDWTTVTEHLTFSVDEETNNVTGRIRIIKPDSAKSARDRAVVILKEVKDQITADAEASSTVFDSTFMGYTAEEGIWSEGGRVCTFEFEIEVEAHDG